MKNSLALGITCLFVYSFLSVVPLYGQPQGMMIGVGASGSFYSGDFRGNSTSVQRVYPGGHISLQKAGKGWLKLSVEAGFGKYVATSSKKIIAPDGVVPVSFVLSPFFYTDLKVNLVPFESKIIQPYVSVGAGLFHFEPQDLNGNALATNPQSRLPEETYNTTIFSLPLSAGLRFRLNQRAALGVEYSYRLTPTDYLDNAGQLGTKEGNDFLQSIQVQLFIKMNPNP